MKKVVNSVLASALALTVAPMVVGAEEETPTVGTQEAAQTQEATQAEAQAPAMDANLEKVVKRLEALKLVAGYGNGEYGVDRTITRAEFATLIVRARGLDQAAKLSQYQNNYTDVKSADWFAGFVNIASTEGIIKGYADKTFKPGNQVTYAEAVTMIVRALGYEPATVNKGVWPNNFISKAAELNITETIADPNKPATRGDIFVMLDNALKVDLMKQTEYGTGDLNYQIMDGKNLLTEYLDVTVYDMEWANDSQNDDLPFVANVPVVGLGKMAANEVTLSFAERDDKDKDKSRTATYKVIDSINPNDYAGQHVQVWIKDDVDDTIVWMEPSTDEQVVFADIDTVYYNDKEVDTEAEIDQIDDGDELDKVEIKLTNDQTYDVSKDVAVTYNYKRYGTDDKAADGLQEMFTDFQDWNITAKVVLDEKGEIVYISGVDNDSVNQTEKGVKYGSQIIKKVDAEKKRIENLDGDDNFKELEDKTEGKDFLVFLNGKPAKLADLQPLDVYSVYYADGDKDKPLVFAVRNVVEGKVDDIKKRSGSDYRVKINDKYYRLYAEEDFSDEATSFSENNNKDVDKITNDQTAALDGEEVKLYLDASGRVRHVETKDNISDRKLYAVVTKSAQYDSKDEDINLKVVDEKGKSHNITLEDDDFKDAKGKKFDNESEIEDAFVAADPRGSDVATVVELELDKDGKVKEVQLVDFEIHESLNNTDTDHSWEKAADEDDEVIEDEAGKDFEVNEDTVVWDLSGNYDDDEEPYVLEDVDTLNFKKLAEKDDDDLEVSYTVDDGEVQFVFVTAGESASDDTLYGYVEDLYRSGGVDQMKIYRNVDGEIKEEIYNLDGDFESASFIEHDFIAFTLNGDDEVEMDKVVEIMDGGGKALEPELVDTILEGKDFDDDGELDFDEAEVQFVDVGKVIKKDGNKITYVNSPKVDEKGEDVGYDADDYNFEDTVLTSSKTVIMNDSWKSDSIQKGDYIVMIETEDDDNEGRLDYVLIIANQDDVKDGPEYDMTRFLSKDWEVDSAVESGNADGLVVTFSEDLYLDGKAFSAFTKDSFTYSGGLSANDVTGVTYATYGSGGYRVTFTLKSGAAEKGSTITSKFVDKYGNVVKFVYGEDGWVAK